MVLNMGAWVSTSPIPHIFFKPTPDIGLVKFGCEELGHVDALGDKLSGHISLHCIIWLAQKKI